MITRCAQCDATMCCRPDGNCWCADYPKMKADPKAEGCLCPECLREKLQAEQKARAASGIA